MNDLATTAGMSTSEVIEQKRRVAELMNKVLKENIHYGIIPGTKKKSLWKSGAEIVALTFGIHGEIEVTKTDLENGHREYEVTTKMFRNSDSMAIGSGAGSCSSMESKYRWRTVKRFNAETKKQEEDRIENPNLQDLFNTVLKMAKKRSFVDAVITATGASDFVTQDIEDFEDVLSEPEPYEAEIEAIASLVELKKYWTANKGKGKKFDQKITEKKTVLEANQKENAKS